MTTKQSIEISRWVYREKVRMLYNNFRQSWILSLLVAGLLCYLAVDAGEYWLGITWWLGFAIIILCRLLLSMKFHRAQINLDEYPHWQRLFFWLTFLAAIGWSVGAILVAAVLDPVGQVFILMLLICVSGGAIPMLGMHQATMLAFQLTMVIPYVLWMAPGMHGRGLLLVFVVGLYLLGIVLAMRRLEKSLAETLTMQYRLEQRTEELQDANVKLEHLAQVDALTQLYNRRYFEHEMEKEWKKARRESQSLALLVVDIDYFKLYNDTYGHAAGDECLRHVARLLSKTLHRPGDVLSRIGGEEFVALLPGIEAEGAMTVAKTMQALLQQAQLIHATSPVSDFVTISIGVALTTPEGDETSLGLFQAADKALYKAKSKGRNHIVTGEIEKMEG